MPWWTVERPGTGEAGVLPDQDSTANRRAVHGKTPGGKPVDFIKRDSRDVSPGCLYNYIYTCLIQMFIYMEQVMPAFPALME